MRSSSGLRRGPTPQRKRRRSGKGGGSWCPCADITTGDVVGPLDQRETSTHAWGEHGQQRNATQNATRRSPNSRETPIRRGVETQRQSNAGLVLHTARVARKDQHGSRIRSARRTPATDYRSRRHVCGADARQRARRTVEGRGIATRPGSPGDRGAFHLHRFARATEGGVAWQVRCPTFHGEQRPYVWILRERCKALLDKHMHRRSDSVSTTVRTP